MPTPVTGELRRLASGFEARIRIDDKGTRKGFALLAIAKTDETGARERCTAMAQIAVRLRRAGLGDDVARLLEMAAKARAGKPWEHVMGAVDALCAGTTAEIDPARPVMTLKQLGEEWTSGRLASKHPDHVRKKKHVGADERILRMYIVPKIGERPVHDLRLEDFEMVMADLPDHLKAASRRHVAQVMSKLASIAVYPCRLLSASPIPRGWLPKGTGKLAMQCLRPAEDKALMACPADRVPLIRRLFFGVLDREGMRREELAEIRFRDLDLDHGAITLDNNKTADPRSWALNPGVVRALAAWKKKYRKDASDDDRVFVDENGIPLSTEHMAEQLRADLKAAGVTRPELFARTDVRIPLRVHDLRSTAVTVWLANGKSEAWCCDRTGHRSSMMLNRYRRAARSWAELGLGELESLDVAIPELSSPHGSPHNPPRPLGGTVYAGDLKADPEPVDLRGDEKTAADRDATCAPPLAAKQSGALAGRSDVDIANLTRAIANASAAGQWAIVTKLQASLDKLIALATDDGEKPNAPVLAIVRDRE